MSQRRAPTRRQFVRLSSAALAGGLLPGLADAAGPPDGPTPRQVEGPFYPVGQQLQEREGAWRDNDLVLVPGAVEPARGTQILVTGRVLAPGGRPAVGVEVDLWQACSEGRYLSRRDPRNKRRRDPGFQYFGRCATGRAGLFAFRTIVPPSYPAGGIPGWIRPRHLHLKVRGLGRRDFVTQMYFDDPDDPANEAENLRLQRRDLVLAEVPRGKWDRLVRPVETLSEGADIGSRLGVAESEEPPWRGLTAPKWAHFPIVLDRELRQE